MPDISVVIPVKDEAGNVASLLAEIRSALAGRSFEVLFVDDGSSDGTADVLKAEREGAPELRILQHETSCGQSSAIRTGVFFAKGAIIVTLDGDGQNDPADIPALLEQLEAPGRNARLALVMGQRLGRKDTLQKRLASRFANWLRRRALADNTRDTGCGIKAFAREAFLRLPYFHGMHRFMPALMMREGYEVEFVGVNHRPRGAGQSKYGVIDRAIQATPDLLGVIWLRWRTHLPKSRIEL